MLRKIIQTSTDAIYPVTRNETKLFLKLEDDADNSLIDNLIKTATDLCEHHIKRTLITKSWQIWYDHFGPHPFKLYKPNIITVDSIKYYLVDNTEVVLASTVYELSGATMNPTVSLQYDQYWPTDSLRLDEAVAIDYTAGYGAAGTDIPATIKHGILMLIAEWYENRETMGSLSNGVKEVWSSKKVWNF